jgi:hypothetical protein
MKKQPGKIEEAPVPAFPASFAPSPPTGATGAATPQNPKEDGIFIPNSVLLAIPLVQLIRMIALCRSHLVKHGNKGPVRNLLRLGNFLGESPGQQETKEKEE